ncbi:MAG: hypothetical protein ACFB13_09090 [Kiloniellaceae bacterium]
MTVRPTTEADIWDLINAALDRMTVAQQRLWEVIQIMPEQWSQRPWSDVAGGFWAVAIIGRYVIWYNHIEGGFNRSTFSEFGEINEYRCNQDGLEEAVQPVLNYIRDGYDSAGHFGPPQSPQPMH